MLYENRNLSVRSEASRAETWLFIMIPTLPIYHPSFRRKKHSFAEEKHSFAEEKHSFAEKKHSFAEKKHSFAKKKAVFPRKKAVFRRKTAKSFPPPSDLVNIFFFFRQDFIDFMNQTVPHKLSTML